METVNIIVAVIVLLIMPFVYGSLYQILREEKGYNGGFWLGFFFGIVALIYAAGLPDRNSLKVVKSEDGESILIVKLYDSVTKPQCDGNPFCANCGNPVTPEDNFCKHCGKEL